MVVDIDSPYPDPKQAPTNLKHFKRIERKKEECRPLSNNVRGRQMVEFKRRLNNVQCYFFLKVEFRETHENLLYHAVAIERLYCHRVLYDVFMRFWELHSSMLFFLLNVEFPERHENLLYHAVAIERLYCHRVLYEVFMRFWEFHSYMCSTCNFPAPSPTTPPLHPHPTKVWA